MPSISDWVALAYDNACSKGFHDEDRGIPESVALMHSELSELLEEHRAGRGPTEIYERPEKPGKPEGIPIELADLVIRAFDFAGKHGIDLEAAIARKHAYNTTRPRKHGKVC